MSGILQGIMNFIQSAFANFSDNFNRTTSGELGTSSSGGVWKSLRGVFAANGSAARSTDLPTTYPVAMVEMTSASTTSSIDVGSTVLVSTTGTVGTISIGNGTTGTVGFFTAVITGMSSTTGMAAGNFISATNGTGSLYGGSPTDVEILSVDSGTQITYRVKGGTQPTAGTVTNINCRLNDGGSGLALWITDSGNWWGITHGRVSAQCNCSTCPTYSCAAFQNASTGSFCGSFTYASAFAGNGTYSYASAYACSGVYTYTTANACSGVYTYTSAPACSGVYTYTSAYAGNGTFTYTVAPGPNGTFSSSSAYACSGVYTNQYGFRTNGYSGPTYSVICPSGYASQYTCSAYGGGAYSCTTYGGGAISGGAYTCAQAVGGGYSGGAYSCSTYGGGAYSCSTYGGGAYSCATWSGGAYNCTSYRTFTYRVSQNFFARAYACNTYSQGAPSCTNYTRAAFTCSAYTRAAFSCSAYTRAAFTGPGAYYCIVYSQNAYVRAPYTCTAFSRAAFSCATYSGPTYICPSGTTFSAGYSTLYAYTLSQPCTFQNYTSFGANYSNYYTNPQGYSNYFTNPCTFANYFTNPCTFAAYYTNPCTFGNYFTNPQGFSNYFSGPTCTGSTFTGFAPFCQSPVYGYTNCNCQTCFPSYIRLIQSSSNVVSEVTRWTLSSMAAAFKVITNAATKIITIRPYKDASMTTQIGSDLTYTATSAIVSTKFGVVLGPSDEVQGDKLDNFNITSN